MKHLIARCIVLAVIIAAHMVPASSALSVSLSPSQISEGGQVTITIRGLLNNSVFAIRILSETQPKADGTFDFRTTGFTMPFVLENGNFLVEAHNVTNKPPDNIAAGVKTKPPGSSGVVSMQQGEYPEGVVQIYDMGRTIPAGTFEFISIFGNAKDGVPVVPVSFEMNGKKKGPDDSELRFNIYGVSSGSANILVTIDGNPQLSQKVTIGSPPSSTTQTTTATTVTTTTTATTTTTGTSTTTGSPTVTTSQVVLPFTVTVSPVTTVSQAPDAISLSSMDSRFTLSASRSAVTGSLPDDIQVMNVGNLPLAGGWNALSSTYLIFPDTARFYPAATVSFSLDDAIVQGYDQYQPFIAAYTGGQWVDAGSTRDGSRMSAPISSGGKFALATRSVTTPAPTPVQQAKITPGSQVTGPQGTLSSPATPTGPPQQATPTQKAGPAWIGCILAAVVALLVVRRRKFP